MIIRIVRMTFQPEKTEQFLKMFSEINHLIRNFEGCTHLELLNDVQEPNVYCTYSIWENEDYLNKYRFSELFKDTWSKTKPLFSAKAVAHSLVRVN